MKKTLSTLLSVLFCSITFAQPPPPGPGIESVPQGINYQAVARDASGAVLMNQTLTIQFSVISDITTSAVSWQEDHSVTTNDFGLFTAIIGGGTSTGGGSSASFSEVDWAAANHYIKVEMDGIDMGTTAFMSVPYALSSGSAANALWQDDGMGNITNTNNGDVQIAGGVDAGYVMTGSVMTGSVDAGSVMTGHLNTMGDAWIDGNAIGMQQPTYDEHLTRKDYVDAGDMNNAVAIMNAEMVANTAITAETVRATAAEAANATAITTEETRATAAESALMNSINNLDSTTTANALWQDDGMGNITNTNNGDVQIAGGVDAGYVMTGSVMTGSVDAGSVMTGHLHTMGDALIDGNASILGDLIVFGNINNASDRRFKKDIVTVDNALSKVLQLRGVNYYWRNNEFPNRGFDDKLELGLIAQEVEAVIPEIVAEIGDGYKGVEYSKLVALLVEAIKEQQAIIDGQKTEMADMRVELDGRLKVLEEMFNTATLNK